MLPQSIRRNKKQTTLNCCEFFFFYLFFQKSLQRVNEKKSKMKKNKKQNKTECTNGREPFNQKDEKLQQQFEKKRRKKNPTHIIKINTVGDGGVSNKVDGESKDTAQPRKSEVNNARKGLEKKPAKKVPHKKNS